MFVIAAPRMRETESNCRATNLTNPRCIAPFLIVLVDVVIVAVPRPTGVLRRINY